MGSYASQYNLLFNFEVKKLYANIRMDLRLRHNFGVL